MAKRFLVIGLGRFGSAVVDSLESQGCEVIAADREMAAVEGVKDKAAFAVQMDTTEPEALRSIEPHTCVAAIVAIGEDFESACLTVASLKELGIKRILARAQTPRRGRILASAGATEILHVETDMGARVGKRLATESSDPSSSSTSS